MRVAATIIAADGFPAQSPAVRSALDAVVAGAKLAALHQRRIARHAAIREFLLHPKQLDAIIPGLSDLDPGPANDLLRQFRKDPFRQLRVPHERLQAALRAARVLCWLRLHRPFLFGDL